MMADSCEAFAIFSTGGVRGASHGSNDEKSKGGDPTGAPGPPPAPDLFTPKWLPPWVRRKLLQHVKARALFGCPACRVSYEETQQQERQQQHHHHHHQQQQLHRRHTAAVCYREGTKLLSPVVSASAKRLPRNLQSPSQEADSAAPGAAPAAAAADAAAAAAGAAAAEGCHEGDDGIETFPSNDRIARDAGVRSITSTRDLGVYIELLQPQRCPYSNSPTSSTSRSS